jgi:2-dehydro-3-deoxyphosphogluconate aldolase / (4S)-4-hydroxy-2-oxoglutarate aldolase
MLVAAPAKAHIAHSLRRAPVIGVVRTSSYEEGSEQAEAFLDAGLELVEITFSVPRATALVTSLLARRGASGPPWIGMGTVTNPARVAAAADAGAEFLVSPNAGRELLQAARASGLFLVAGALTPTEIVAASEGGADLVKVYPLPPVGGPRYLATIRQPLGDIPMLAAGGFGVDEIPAYRGAGAVAFGLGSPLLGADREETRQRVARALELARGEEAR